MSVDGLAVASRLVNSGICEPASQAIPSLLYSVALQGLPRSLKPQTGIDPVRSALTIDEPPRCRLLKPFQFHSNFIFPGVPIPLSIEIRNLGITRLPCRLRGFSGKISSIASSKYLVGD